MSNRWIEYVVMFKNNRVRLESELLGVKHEVTLAEEHPELSSLCYSNTLYFCDSSLTGEMKLMNGYYRHFQVWDSSVMSIDKLKSFRKLYNLFETGVDDWSFEGQYTSYLPITGLLYYIPFAVNGKNDQATTVGIVNYFSTTGYTLNSSSRRLTNTPFWASQLNINLVDDIGSSVCNGNCQKCSYNNKCLLCEDGFSLTSDNECQINSNTTYYTFIPTKTFEPVQKDLTLSTTTPIHLKTKMRLLGTVKDSFKNGSFYALIEVTGSGTDLKLEYVPATDILKLVVDTTDKVTINNFSGNFGKWLSLEIIIDPREAGSIALYLNNTYYYTEVAFTISASSTVLLGRNMISLIDNVYMSNSNSQYFGSCTSTNTLTPNSLCLLQRSPDVSLQTVMQLSSTTSTDCLSSAVATDTFTGTPRFRCAVDLEAEFDSDCSELEIDNNIKRVSSLNDGNRFREETESRSFTRQDLISSSTFSEVTWADYLKGTNTEAYNQTNSFTVNVVDAVLNKSCAVNYNVFDASLQESTLTSPIGQNFYDFSIQINDYVSTSTVFTIEIEYMVSEDMNNRYYRLYVCNNPDSNNQCINQEKGFVFTGVQLHNLEGGYVSKIELDYSNNTNNEYKLVNNNDLSGGTTEVNLDWNKTILFRVEQYDSDLLNTFDSMSMSHALRLTRINFYAKNIANNLSFNGLACTDENANDCKEGMNCGTSECVSCWPGCSACSFNSSWLLADDWNNKGCTNTSKCSYLSEFQATSTSADADCPLKFTNLASFGDDKTFSFTEINPQRTSGFTLGFWIFTKKLTVNGGDTTDFSFVEFSLDNLFKITLKNVNDSTYSYDTLQATPEYYQTEGNTYFPAENVYEKWTYIKIGLHQDRTYNLSNDDTDYNAFIDFIYLANGQNLIYNTNDYKFSLNGYDSETRNHRRIFQTGDKLTFNMKTKFEATATEKELFIREVSLFGDFVRTSYENYSLRSKFNDIDTLLFYLPLDDVNTSYDYQNKIYFEYFSKMMNYDKSSGNDNSYYWDRPTTTFDISVSHPTSSKFTALNLLEPNTVYRNNYRETVSYSCTSGNLMCVVQPDFTQNSLFCDSSTHVLNYSMIKNRPAFGTCSTLCSANTLCSNNCHSDLVGCQPRTGTSCSDSNYKLLGNDCVLKLNDPLYDHGVFYYNHQFKTPDTIIDLTGTAIPEFFTFNFWYLPESEARFRQGVSTSEPNYVLYTNKFKIYIQAGNFLFTYIESEAIDPMDTTIITPTWSSAITLGSLASAGSKWVDFRIYTENHFLTIVSKTLGFNNNYHREKEVDFEKIVFSKHDNLGTDILTPIFWYPGYYKKMELWDSQKSTFLNVLNIRRFFSNLTSELRRMHNTNAFPNFTSLTNQLPFTDIEDYTANNLELVTTSPGVTITRSQGVDTSINYYWNNYSVINENMFECDQDCSLCNSYGCYECKENLTLTSDYTCTTSTNSANNLYYYRHSNADAHVLNVIASSTTISNKFTISLYVKLMSLKSTGEDIILLGNSMKIKYLKASDELNLYGITGLDVKATNFRRGMFDQWINITVAGESSSDRDVVVFSVNYTYQKTTIPTTATFNFNFNGSTNTNGFVGFTDSFLGLVKGVRISNDFDQTGDNEFAPFLNRAGEYIDFSSVNSACIQPLIDAGRISETGNTNNLHICKRDVLPTFDCENSYTSHQEILLEMIHVSDQELNVRQRNTKKAETYFGSTDPYNNQLLGSIVPGLSTAWIDYVHAATFYSCVPFVNWEPTSMLTTTGAIAGTNIIEFELKFTPQTDINSINYIYFTLFSVVDITDNINIYFCADPSDTQVCNNEDWTLVKTISGIPKGQLVRDETEITITMTSADPKYTVNSATEFEGYKNGKVLVRLGTDGDIWKSWTEGYHVIQSVRLVKYELFYDMTTTCDGTPSCLDGEICVTNVCQKCWPGCNSCTTAANNANNESFCSSCGYLSTFTDTTASNNCPLEYVNYATFTEDIDLTMTVNKPNYGVTLGFWVFANKMNNKQITFVVDELLELRLKNKDITNPKTYSTYGILPSIYSVESTEFYTTDSSYEKWTHIKVGFHSDFTYIKGDTKYNAFVDTVQYHDGKPVYHKWDFYRQLSTFEYRSNKKIFDVNSQFNFKIKNENIATVSPADQVYLQQVVLFTDYIRTDFQEYKLKAMNAIKNMYFVIPFDDVYFTGADGKVNIKVFSNTYTSGDNSSDLENSSYIDPAEAHPTSLSFYRLNLLEPNTKYKNRFWETDSYTCSSGLDYCINNVDQAEAVVFCSNDKTLQYDNLWAVPVQGSCVDSCAADKICTDDCHNAEQSCTVKVCTDSTNYRWFDNKCLNKDNDVFYQKGALYHSNQFKTPEITIPTSSLNKYIVSLWYYPETVSSLMVGCDLTSTTIKHYIFESTGLSLYVFNNKEVYASFGGTELKVSTGSDFQTGFWIHFVIDSDTQRLKIKAKSIGIDFTYRRAAPIVLNDIKFTYKDIASNEIWLPGYYKNVEVFDARYLDLYNYQLLKTYFNKDTDKEYFFYEYPKHMGLDQALSLADKGVVNRLDSKFNFASYALSDFETSYYFNSDRVRLDTCRDPLSQQVFNYGIVNPDYSDIICPENCAECGGTECYVCRDEFMLDPYGVCQRVNSEHQTRYYFRSPVHQSSSKAEVSATDQMNAKVTIANAVSDTFTFSIFIKILGTTDTDALLWRFGNLQLRYNYDSDTVYLRTNTINPFISVGNFRASNFGRWVNFAVSFDLGQAKQINRNALYYVDYSYHKRENLNINKDFEINVNNGFGVATQYLEISHQFIGLVSHAYYDPSQYHKPSYLINDDSKIIKFYAFEVANCLSESYHQGFTGNYIRSCVADYEHPDYECRDRWQQHLSELNQHLIVQEYEKNISMQLRKRVESGFGGIQRINYTQGTFITPSSDYIEFVQIGALYTCPVKEHFDIFLQESVGVTLPEAEDMIFGFDILFDVAGSYEQIAITYYASEDIADNSIKFGVCTGNASDNRCNDGAWEVLTTIPGTVKNTFRKLIFEVKRRASPGAGQSLYYASFDSTTVDLGIDSNQKLYVIFSPNSADYSSGTRRFLAPPTINTTDTKYLRLTKLEIYSLENETDITSQNYLKNGSVCSTDADCLESHICVVVAPATTKTCEKCWPGCSKCNERYQADAAFTHAKCKENTYCSYLSDAYQTTDSSEYECNLDYINMGAYQTHTINVDIPKEHTLKYAGFTIGFWIFTTPLANGANSIDWEFILKDIMSVKLSNKQVPTNGSNYDTINVIPTIYGVERAQKYTADNIYEKWVHYKIGFHNEDVYQDADKTYNAFIDSTYYNGAQLVRNKHDFYVDLSSEGNRSFQKIYDCEEKFNIKLGKTLVGTHTVESFFREVIIFRDYVRTNFEDYDLLPLIQSNDVKPFYFYMPLRGIHPEDTFSSFYGKVHVPVYSMQASGTVRNDWRFFNFDPYYAHPQSPKFTRLNLFTSLSRFDSINIKYQNYYSEYDEFTCQANTVLCLKNPTDLVNVFCDSSMATMQYNDLQSIPTLSECRNDCQVGKLCTDLCESYELNCTAKCTDSTNQRWFDNKCYANDGSFYDNFALYYSSQFQSPNFELPVGATTDQYILSFWVYPESNANFLVGVDTASKKNYFFVTDSIKFYVHDNKFKSEFNFADDPATITADYILGDFVAGQWYNIVVHSKDTTTTINKFSFGNTASEVNTVANISKVQFDKSVIPGDSAWYPSFYRYVEVLDSTHYTNSNYLGFRTFYNVFEMNKHHLRDNWPKLHSHYILWTMTSWYVSDPLLRLTTGLVNESNAVNDYKNEYFLLGLDGTTEIKPSSTCAHMNNYFFNYSTFEGKADDCDDVNCDFCNTYTCTRCKDGFQMNISTKLCEFIPNTNNWYFRNPLTDYSNPMFTRADGNAGDLEVKIKPPTENVSTAEHTYGTPYEFTFSIFLKPVGFTAKNSKVITIGGLELTFNHEASRNFFYLTPAKSFTTTPHAHSDVQFQTEFTYPEFDTWINISFSFYRNYYNNSGLLKLAPTMLTYQYTFRYSEHFVLDKLVDGTTEDLSYRDILFNNMVIHKDYVGLISNFRYMHRYLYHPSTINNYNDYSIDLYVLPFSSSTASSCLTVDTSGDQSEYNKELSQANQKTTDFASCVNSVGPDFFNDCEISYSKIQLVDQLAANVTEYITSCETSTKSTRRCQYTYRNIFADGQNDQQCACLSNIDDFMMWKDDSNNYSCIPHQRQINIAAYTPITFEDYNTEYNSSSLVIRQYSFETWIYLKSYTTNGMKGYEFQWRNQLRIAIDQTDGQSNKFEIACYPRYVNNIVGNNSVNNQKQVLSGFDSKWYHIRCSVDIDALKYVYTSNIHETQEENLINNNVSLSAGDAPFKFIVANERMIASGRIFVRQMRLWKCYYCYYPQINYRTIVDDLSDHMISDYFSDKIINNWEILDLDGEYTTDNDEKFSNSITKTQNYLSLNRKYYRITFEDKFTLHEIRQVNSSDEITYINRKDAFVNNLSEKDPEYLVTMDDYYSKRHLANLGDYEDINTEVNRVAAPIEGRYTIDFYFRQDSSLDDFDKGLNIIFSDTISIALSSLYFTDSTNPSLEAYCFPHEYKVKLGTKRNNEVRGAYDSALNKEKITIGLYDKQWVHYRCAVSENDDEFYFQKDGAADTTVNAFNKLQSYRRQDSGASNDYTFVLQDQLYRRIFHPNDTIQLEINGAAQNKETSRIYLRHIYYFNEYLPRNIDWRNYNINDLPLADIPSRLLSIDFAKLDFMRTDTTLEYELEGTTHRVSLSRATGRTLAHKTLYVDYTLENPSACNNDRGFAMKSSQEQCLIIECNSNFEHCRQDNTPLVCPAGNFLMYNTPEGYTCTPTCHGYGHTRLGLARHPGALEDIKGGFCNFKCDGSKYKTDSTWTRLCECDSRLSTDSIEEYGENYFCPKDLNRFGYKCFDDERANKGRIYFNECYDFPNMSATVGSYEDEKVDYTLGFWFKLDNLNNECSWNADTAKESNGLFTNKTIKRHVFYSNMHVLYTDNDSNNKLFYEINGFSKFKTPLEVNSASWNQITFFVSNKNSKKVNIHVNFHPNALDNSIDYQDNNNELINLVLTKIGFCDRPDCLAVGDDVNWSAAFYKDMFYVKEIPMNIDLIRDRTFEKSHTKYYTFPLNLLHSDLDNLKDQYRNNASFQFVDSAYNKALERTNVMNYNSMFDWEEENLGNVIKSEDSVHAFASESCNTTNLEEGSTANDIVGCSRCFKFDYCYRCYDDPVEYKNNYYLEMTDNNKQGKCTQNVNVYTEFPPIKGTETAQNFESFSFPLDDPNPPVEGSNTRVFFKDLKQFTFGIFIKFKALMEGVCSENLLISYHDDLHVCYDEPNDSLVLMKKNGNQISVVPNYTESHRNKWIFFGMSINIANELGIKNMLSFSINQNDIGTTDANNLITPPSNQASDYFFKVYYKNKAYLYNYKLYNTFILKPYGYINNTFYTNFELHYGLTLVTEQVHLLEDTSLLCINNQLKDYPYMPKFNCSFDSGFNFYVSSQCTTKNFSVFSNNGLLSCQQCKDCLKGCSDGYEGNCSFDNSTGHAILHRVSESKAGELNNYVTQSTNLEFIDLNRYSSTTVSGVKRSTTLEYSMDFWFFTTFYTTETRDQYFKKLAFTWDGHQRIEILLRKNAETGENQIDMDCYIAYNSDRNSDINKLKKEGFNNIPENKWTHLKCGVRLRDNSGTNKLYFTNAGRNSFLLDDYTFNTEGTTKFMFENTSKANFGLAMAANLQLWETYSVENMNLHDCVVRNPKNYRPLIHYFTGLLSGEFPKFDLIDVHDDTTSTGLKKLEGTLVQQSEYLGYGVFNDIKMEFSTADFRSCLNLQVNPYSKKGQNGITPFDLYCIADDANFESSKVEIKYSVLPDKEKQTNIPIENGRRDDFIFNISEQLGLCKDKENIEVFCIATYNRGSEKITDLVSDTLFLDRQISAVNNRSEINKLKAQLSSGQYNAQEYQQILNQLSGEIVGDNVQCDLETNTCTFGVATDQGGACVCQCPCGRPLGNLCVTDAEAEEIRAALEDAYDKFLESATGNGNGNGNTPTETPQRRRRRLQVSTAFGSDELDILYNIIKTSIDVNTVDYVNSKYLDLVDNLLYNPKQENIVSLIASEYNKFVEIVDILYDFYNKKLREKQNELFYVALETNSDPRIIFDVSFMKYDAVGSSFRNYTQINNFEKTPEYKNSAYIMSINFTDYLIEARNNEIKKAAETNSFSMFERFFDRVSIYLGNIAKVTIKNNTLVSDPLFFINNGGKFNYNYIANDFVFDVRIITKDFDFGDISTKYPDRSYFDASSLLSNTNSDSPLFYMYYISFDFLPENYYYTVEPFTGNLNFELFNSDKIAINNVNYPMTLSLRVSPLRTVTDYLSTHSDKYVKNYKKYLASEAEDVIRQPYYVDEDGNINYEWTKIERYNEYHPEYIIQVNSNEDYFESLNNPFVFAKVPSSGRYYATVRQNTVNYEDYDNDYFWERTEIYENSENYKRNPSVYVWCIFTFLFILAFIIFLVTRVIVIDSSSSIDILRAEIRDYYSKLCFNDDLYLGDDEDNILDTQNAEEMNRIKDSEQKEILGKQSDLPFCEVFTNLLSVNRFSWIFSSSTFLEPKYKRINNLWFFWNLFYVFFSVILTFNEEINLKGDYEDYIKNIIGYFFASYGLALAGNILFVVIFIADSRDNREDLKNGVNKGNVQVDLADSIATKNVVKASIMFFLNLCLSAVLFYSAVGFSAYWINYRGIMEIGLPCMLLADFLIIDLLVGFLMTLFYACRFNCLFKFFNFFKKARCI
eukprot:CAMPEP_0170538970 /NCGR_PEP_ID=MMETSP0209-20121228/103634_1 /TAXON_ID=665100 ORGANISM="Litonotus pictus, Strain P1" /NCGR_SAMPLE_ID=MMETSP0209 /ASSEMBLY_ACC=CAM_ASM_000301 /LENGTH=6770 /DNA_ID=CAMNT_0010840779 /DNA_START=1657 /DNA_END=21969 /DNA_ORIENTATION=+